MIRRAPILLSMMSLLFPAPAPAYGGASVSFSSEATRRMSAEALERSIAATLAAGFTLVRIERHLFDVTATLRMRPEARDEVCAAAQIVLHFVPDPSRQPKGTRPGAIHASRLPMQIIRSEASEVFRRGPPQLKGWFREMAPDPCGSVDPRAAFFAAADEAQAARALYLFDRTIREARTGQPSFRAECRGPKPVSCLGAIAALKEDDILAVDAQCAVDRDGDRRWPDCVSLLFPDVTMEGRVEFHTRLEIRMPQGRSTYRGDIESVTLDYVQPAVV